MAATLSPQLLDRLDRLIAATGLHLGAYDEPVQIAPALEAYSTGYGAMPERVRAVTMRWQHGKQRFTDISLNQRLRSPDLSAERRYAQAHEFAHVFCKHRGDFFMLIAGGESSRFDDFLDGLQERQCDQVAAYLLVPLGALVIMRDRTSAEVAWQLDVPVTMVELRWAVWRTHRR